MKRWLSSIIRWIEHSETRQLESYLAQSASAADLERRMRDWESKNADRAVRVMQKRGLNVDTSQQEYSDSVPEGFVIAQDPVGQVLHRGDTVSLTVSKGPQLVEVPGDLRGMGIDAARQALESLGFHVELDRTDFYVGLGYVVGSDPDPGSMAPHGSTVTLKIV